MALEAALEGIAGMSGLPAVMLFSDPAFRLAGTYLSVMGTGLNPQKRIFCMLAQILKATVQAAAGGMPLAMGLSGGTACFHLPLSQFIPGADRRFSDRHDG